MWSDMEHCEARLESARRSAIRQSQFPVVFGKCHYVLVEEPAAERMQVPMS